MTQAQHCAEAAWAALHAPPLNQEEKAEYRSLIAAEMARYRARQEAKTDLFDRG
jgi:hypothetical protein